MNLIDKLKNNWTAWGGLTDEEKECFRNIKTKILLLVFWGDRQTWESINFESVIDGYIIRIPQDYQPPKTWEDKKKESEREITLDDFTPEKTCDNCSYERLDSSQYPCNTCHTKNLLYRFWSPKEVGKVDTPFGKRDIKEPEEECYTEWIVKHRDMKSSFLRLGTKEQVLKDYPETTWSIEEW